ncbi:MAG: hypothetical protein LBF62_12745 [Tannerellaceae bacterium]|nr:hypothetical protein [Tannerellaceae bacterium]
MRRPKSLSACKSLRGQRSFPSGTLHFKKEANLRHEESLSLEKATVQRHEESLSLEKVTVLRHEESLNLEKATVLRHEESLNLEKVTVQRHEESLRFIPVTATSSLLRISLSLYGASVLSFRGGGCAQSPAQRFF